MHFKPFLRNPLARKYTAADLSAHESYRVANINLRNEQDNNNAIVFYFNLLNFDKTNLKYGREHKIITMCKMCAE